jgi:gamma-glutamylcyclotransferase (GGCT)/AIG2-like uncharacterized protein YtfP
MKIFVYGTLKKDYWNNRLLEGATYLGEAITNNNYLMTGNGIPYIHPFEGGLPVKGEVYEIDEKLHLPRLDALEGHPHAYTRTTISASLLSPTDDDVVVNVDVYEMLRLSWGGEPLTPVVSDGRKYFEWSR